ncbi:hypothetical protein Vretifemale_2204 [Volvox reticuliferus]|nr:hypothetical protein Vretifemale_2204 [Volvox reticuliferus]
MQPRVALLRNDGTAAAVFTVSDSGPAGGINSAMSRRRSRDVVLVDAGGSGFSNCKSPDFFMLGQPSFLEQDSIGTPATIAGAPGGGGACGTGGGMLGKSGGDDAVLQRMPGGPSGVTAPNGPCCRGQSLPLQHTLLAEALTRGSGLCIADCNAYVQDSKAFPRDLMIVPRGNGSSTPPQSLALATSCHGGRPLLALYATYHSILPQALLQTVVQELGQLLRALTPIVAALLLPGGRISEEWILLHDDLLGPACMGHSSGNTSKARTNNSMIAPSAATTAAAAAAKVNMTAAPCTPRAGCCPPPVLMVSPPTGGGAGRDGGATAAAAVVNTDGGGGGSTIGIPSRGGECSVRSSRVSLQPRGPAAGTALGVMAQMGAIFRRTTTAGSSRQHNGSTLALPTPAGCTAAGDAAIAAMTAAAVVLAGGADAAVTTDAAAVDVVHRTNSSTTASKRLAAFVSGGGGSGADADGAGPQPVGSLQSGMSRRTLARSNTGRTSFSLEVVGSPRGGVRLAPLITTLHDRLKSAQAEQLTSSGRAASRMQDLGSLRFLERVGKGGYGSVYRGLYHGSEVAIKVVEDPGLGNTAAATAKPLTTAASFTLRAKHIHDAIELVASVSMSHPNIVQLITYFVDVKAYRCHHRDKKAATPCAGAEGSNLVTHAADGGGESESLHLVRMTSSGVDSSSSSLTGQGGNEAIVFVMEYCDRGSLKDAIQDGSFLQREALAHVISLHKQQQQGGHQQQQQLQQHVAAFARGGMGPLSMKAVYSTLLEVALALRHMHWHLQPTEGHADKQTDAWAHRYRWVYTHARFTGPCGT